MRMIHFDFVVSDEEANTIFECITEEIENTQTELFSVMEATSTDMRIVQHIKEEIELLKKRVKYLQELKEKMKNIKVGIEDY